MKRLMARGEAIARDEQRRRLEAIAGDLREVGIRAHIGASAVVLTGRHLFRRWLTDPAVRFAARIGR